MTRAKKTLGGGAGLALAASGRRLSGASGSAPVVSDGLPRLHRRGANTLHRAGAAATAPTRSPTRRPT